MQQSGAQKALLAQQQQQAAQAAAELDYQKQLAQTASVNALQGKLDDQTNQMARMFGSKGLLAAGGAAGMRTT